MKRAILDNALHQPIILELKFQYNKLYKGYLVRDMYHPKQYKILPLDINQETIVFPASYVKQYKFLNNGFLVK